MNPSKRALILVSCERMAELLRLPRGIKVLAADSRHPNYAGAVQVLVEGEPLANCCLVVPGDTVTTTTLECLPRLLVEG